MIGGNKRIKIKNWRHLMVLAIVAVLFFGGAYWLAGDPAENDADEEAVAEQVEVKQPLPETERGQQVKQLFSDDSFQKELPKALDLNVQNTSPMPAWVAKLILYTLVALGVFTVAVFIWVLVTGNTTIKPVAKVAPARRKKQTQSSEPAHALAQHATFETASAMAAKGNYGEAVRALLAVSLIHLSQRELVRLRPWMTGREIVQDANLLQEAKTALEYLVFTVEAYAFAGDEIKQETYEACLTHHDLLTKSKVSLA